MKEGLRSTPLSGYKDPIPNQGESHVRVKRIILDDKTYPDLFNEFGGWASLGMIFFETTSIPYNNDSFEFNKTNNALPLFPNLKNYPLVNELVYLVSLPTPDIQNNTTITRTYYFSPINLWNNNHHNAIPDNIFNDNQDISLGNTFKENKDIKSLQPFEGDLIVEGRFGNSLRLSSTVSGSTNNWSSSGQNGDPITILRNGQSKIENESWIPTTEDINEDKSSIYLSSTQKIPLELGDKFESFDNKPISVKEFSNKSQIIVKSGRLVFNSYEDDIILSSKGNISLSSDYIGFDIKNQAVIKSPKIFLGDKKATEPLLLGNKTIILLKKIFLALNELSNVLPSVGTPIPNTPNIAVAQASTKLSETLNQLLPQLDRLKSSQNFTL